MASMHVEILGMGRMLWSYACAAIEGRRRFTRGGLDRALRQWIEPCDQVDG